MFLIAKILQMKLEFLSILQKNVYGKLSEDAFTGAKDTNSFFFTCTILKWWNITPYKTVYSHDYRPL